MTSYGVGALHISKDLGEDLGNPSVPTTLEHSRELMAWTTYGSTHDPEPLVCVGMFVCVYVSMCMW